MAASREGRRDVPGFALEPVPDSELLKRRRLLKSVLWTAGLSVFGALPSACARRWSLLPPRRVPWAMKPLSSAKTTETVLSDDRVQLRVEHSVLRGVTPAMLEWWFRNMDGVMELGGQTHPRYLVWHPVDHIHLELARRLPDGSVGPGAVYHIVEALGADMDNLIDARLHLRELSEAGALVEVRALAQTVLQLRGDFLQREGGAALVSTMTIGSTGWLGGLRLNALLVARFFPPARRKAWLKHVVEEFGNLEFFLPDLYRRRA